MKQAMYRTIGVLIAATVMLTVVSGGALASGYDKCGCEDGHSINQYQKASQNGAAVAMNGVAANSQTISQTQLAVAVDDVTVIGGLP
jgi:hypothetical protein